MSKKLEELHTFMEKTYNSPFKDVKLQKEKASVTEDILKVMVGKNISVEDALTALDDAKILLKQYVKC